jgi:hypothetical protein
MLSGSLVGLLRKILGSHRMNQYKILMKYSKFTLGEDRNNLTLFKWLMEGLIHQTPQQFKQLMLVNLLSITVT